METLTQNTEATRTPFVPWNKGKVTGQKPPLKPREVWAIRVRLQIANRVRDLALFNLAIDSKLRGCDLVSEATPPPPIDEAAAERFVNMVATAVGYMRDRGVRVCNISWGFTVEAVEGSLAQNGLEGDAEARARRAQAIFNTMFAGMERALASTPDILFVVAAGNAGVDVDFTRDLPGSINLPNVITVAAADAEGHAASFASTGASVDLYALGTNVESVVPGGGRVRWSGASLAAPQVVNAAAKLLAIEPRLSAADLVRRLMRTASPAPGADLPLLNLRAARDAR